MKDTIIFNGKDEEEQIEVTAQELKEYATSEVASKNEEQDSELSGIKERLDALEIQATEFSESMNSINEENTETFSGINTSIEGLSNSITQTNESISQEVTARQTATENVRTELTEYVDSEIEKEKTERTEFQEALQNQIVQEYNDRQQADIKLEERLNQQISNSLTAVDFASADKVVKSDLTAHIESVQTQLTTEIKELEARVDEFRTSLNEETANRIKADNALQNSGGSGSTVEYSENYELMTIDHLDKGEVSGDSIFLQSLNATDSYVTASQIKTWLACASQKDFEAEVASRKSEDARLEAKLTTETTSRTEADRNLQNQIDGLDTRTSTAEATLNTLTGTGEGSIAKSINDKIAEVVSEAPEAFDTLKEIADWVSEHETDVLSMQGSITENARAISKETDERKNETARLQLTIEAETSNRINSDSALQESIVNLNQALEAETAERENTKTFIHDTLKEEFEEQIADITNNKIGEIVDDRLAEVVSEVSKNTQNIAVLGDEVSDNKSSIDTLNDTVFSEKDAERILVSTTSGTPQWQTLSSLVKSVNINSSNIDERGNLHMNVPSTAKIVSFANGSNSIDGFLVPFKSSNGQWYIHVANWWGGIYGNGTVRGTAYYIE